MRKPLPVVLICDDDSVFHLAVKHSLRGIYDCKSAYNGDEGLAIIRSQPVDALVLDVQIRTPDEGLRYIPRFRELDPDLAIVVSSGLTEFSVVREALRQGATDYVPKDFNPDELQITIGRVLERRELRKRREQQNFEAVHEQRRHVMIGSSARMQELRRVIERVRGTSANVVITGETGTGKEVVARQLRGELSDGSLAPFVAIDSSTIQSTIAESTLFGHEKGAFTGADSAAKGVFEEADGGIAYFDEIGNLSLDIQAKLLRAIQEREIVRIGSARPIKLDFRVICATNRSLEQMVERGEFKGDLFQRLNVIPIELAPLRERREDIAELVAHFAARERKAWTLSEDALEALQSYAWPGNIRELANVVSFVAAMAEGPTIELADLPAQIRDAASPRGAGGYYDKLASFERDLLSAEYERQGKNVSRLAIELGMDRSHLHKKLKEHGIHKVPR